MGDAGPESCEMDLNISCSLGERGARRELVPSTVLWKSVLLDPLNSLMIDRSIIQNINTR